MDLGPIFFIDPARETIIKQVARADREMFTFDCSLANVALLIKGHIFVGAENLYQYSETGRSRCACIFLISVLVCTYFLSKNLKSSSNLFLSCFWPFSKGLTLLVTISSIAERSDLVSISPY